MAKASQPLFERHPRQRVAISVVVAEELLDEFIGTLQVLLSNSRVVVPVEIGNRIHGDLAQRASNCFGNRFVSVVLLHTGSGGIQWGIIS